VSEEDSIGLVNLPAMRRFVSATFAMTQIVQAPVRQDGIESLIGIDSASKRFVLRPGVATVSSVLHCHIRLIAYRCKFGRDFDREGAMDVVLLGSLPSLGRRQHVVFHNHGEDHLAASTVSRPE
jgi:hypothetical protein